MIQWEGAELCYYFNGESHAVDLSDAQFAIITKILGLQFREDGAVRCFSDDALKRIVEMKGNPLRLEQRDKYSRD